MDAHLFYDRLTPFVSLTLAKAGGLRVADQLERCLRDIKKICAAESDPSTSEFEILPVYKSSAGVEARAMTYRREVRPPWTTDKRLTDVQHHLALAVIRRGHLALHTTDPKLKGPIRAALVAEATDAAPLTWLSSVPRATMSAAFLEKGQAKTLWLSGIHRRSATRADAKILAGQDLDYSLDPFDDQSFYWSSARSRSPSLEITIGVSPKASRVWVGKANSLAAFAHDVAVLIDAVAGAKASDGEPFRFLATPMEIVDPAKVRGAYDVSILPPDMRADGDEDAETTNADAALILEANLTATSAAGASVAIVIEINGEAIGSLTLGVTVGRDGKVKFKPEPVSPAGVADDKFERLTTLLGRGSGVNIRYDSGHSISDRQVYSLRASRIGFNQFDARDFTDYKLKQEKPKDLSKIGGDKSLFSWVLKTHSGWLACDDGANEKADFIHLDESGERPVLSLIHVKGAKSDKPGRGLSVSAYEVVTGQAVKNLQWLDKENLAEGLAASVRATNYWWKDGAPVPKEDLVAAIASLGDDFVRRVVIVQPHVTERARKEADKAKSGVKRLRLDQLNTLLASAWRSANGLGFEFEVVWSI